MGNQQSQIPDNLKTEFGAIVEGEVGHIRNILKTGDQSLKKLWVRALQAPGFRGLLAGFAPTQPRFNNPDEIKKELESILESARNVAGPKIYGLPWEDDKQGSYFIHDTEKLEEKIKYLAMFLNKIYKNGKLEDYNKDSHGDGDFPAFYDQKQYEAMSRMATVLNMTDHAKLYLIQLMSEHHLLLTEKTFRKRLRDWMLGQGFGTEYTHDKIPWVDRHKVEQVYNKLKNLQASRNQSIHDLLQDPSVSNNDKQALKELISIYSLTNVNPNIAQGFILEEDLLQLKVNVFLERLAQTSPKNDAEALLFYKYVVLNTTPNFDYIYSPHYFVAEEKRKKK